MGPRITTPTPESDHDPRQISAAATCGGHGCFPGTEPYEPAPPTLLSYLLSSYHIPVHYAGSAHHNQLLRLRAASFDHHHHEIHFHDFPLPPFASPDPDPTSHNFPAHLYPSFKASMKLREPVSRLFRQLSSTTHRLVIILDSLMGYVVQDAVSLSNAETYVFRAISAFTSFFCDWEAKGKPFETEVQVPDGGLPTMEDCFTKDVMEFLSFQSQFWRSSEHI